MGLFGRLVRDERVNAMLGWAIVGVVALVAVRNALKGSLLRAAFAAVVVVVAALPAVSAGEWTTFVPWPLAAVLAAAFVGQALGVAPELADYVTVATLALVVAVEMDTFTGVDMSRRFAVVFAVLLTMALQGLWTIARFYSDRWLGTAFLRSQTELQWDFVIVTAVGAVLGVLFEWYLRLVDPADSRDRLSEVEFR